MLPCLMVKTKILSDLVELDYGGEFIYDLIKIETKT